LGQYKRVSSLQGSLSTFRNAKAAAGTQESVGRDLEHERQYLARSPGAQAVLDLYEARAAASATNAMRLREKTMESLAKLPASKRKNIEEILYALASASCAILPPSSVVDAQAICNAEMRRLASRKEWESLSTRLEVLQTKLSSLTEESADSGAAQSSEPARDGASDDETEHSCDAAAGGIAEDQVADIRHQVMVVHSSISRIRREHEQ